jgi:uncharacterized protein YihD (DUF1040 family)
MARDPKRIPLILKQLEEIWQEHPDLRLGQLILNMVRGEYPNPTLYYMEDDRLIDHLRKYGLRN